MKLKRTIKLLPNIELLAEEYNNGSSLTCLGNKYNICRRKLSRHLGYYGVTVRLDNQIYNYNETYFDVIDTEEKAYWLGFLYADGWISADSTVVSLSLKSADLHHIEKFRDIISPNSKIAQKNVKLGEKIFSAHTFCITNRPLHDALIAKGCTPRKSLTLKFPSENQVPANLIRHFIRGYFDGDGCICYTEKQRKRHSVLVQFLGTKEMLSSLQDVLIKEIPSYTRMAVRLQHKSKAYFFGKGGKNSPCNLLHYMYNDASVYLERKREKYLLAYAELSGNR